MVINGKDCDRVWTTRDRKEHAMIEAHKAGCQLARNGETRAYVNDVAKTLPVDEADALLAGYYAELRRRQTNILNRIESL
jgi:hypothetical protein